MAAMAYPRALPPEPLTAQEPTRLLRVFVPGNPASSNHMYGVRGNGGNGRGAARHLTAEARAWRDAVTLLTRAWRFPDDAPRPLLAVSFVFLGGRADVDNMVKLALDGVKLGLAVDDRYVMRLYAEKQPLPRGGTRGAWIEVTVLPPPVQPPRPQRTRKRITHDPLGQHDPFSGRSLRPPRRKTTP